MDVNVSAVLTVIGFVLFFGLIVLSLLEIGIKSAFHLYIALGFIAAFELVVAAFRGEFGIVIIWAGAGLLMLFKANNIRRHRS